MTHHLLVAVVLLTAYCVLVEETEASGSSPEERPRLAEDAEASESNPEQKPLLAVDAKARKSNPRKRKYDGSGPGGADGTVAAGVQAVLNDRASQLENQDSFLSKNAKVPTRTLGQYRFFITDLKNALKLVKALEKQNPGLRSDPNVKDALAKIDGLKEKFKHEVNFPTDE